MRVFHAILLAFLVLAATASTSAACPDHPDHSGQPMDRWETLCYAHTFDTRDMEGEYGHADLFICSSR
jgi:hypothetical protein